MVQICKYPVPLADSKSCDICPSFSIRIHPVEVTQDTQADTWHYQCITWQCQVMSVRFLQMSVDIKRTRLLQLKNSDNLSGKISQKIRKCQRRMIQKD